MPLKPPKARSTVAGAEPRDQRAGGRGRARPAGEVLHAGAGRRDPRLHLARQGDHDPPRGLPEREGADAEPGAVHAGRVGRGRRRRRASASRSPSTRGTARACSRTSRARSPSTARTSSPTAATSRTDGEELVHGRGRRREGAAGAAERRCATSKASSTRTARRRRARRRRPARPRAGRRSPGRSREGRSRGRSGTSPALEGREVTVHDRRRPLLQAGDDLVALRLGDPAGRDRLVEPLRRPRDDRRDQPVDGLALVLRDLRERVPVPKPQAQGVLADAEERSCDVEVAEAAVGEPARAGETGPAEEREVAALDPLLHRPPLRLGQPARLDRLVDPVLERLLERVGQLRRGRRRAASPRPRRRPCSPPSASAGRLRRRRWRRRRRGPRRRRLRASCASAWSCSLRSLAGSGARPRAERDGHGLGRRRSA